jgi:hypothetical protein
MDRGYNVGSGRNANAYTVKTLDRVKPVVYNKGRRLEGKSYWFEE